METPIFNNPYFKVLRIVPYKSLEMALNQRFQASKLKSAFRCFSLFFYDPNFCYLKMA